MSACTGSSSSDAHPGIVALPLAWQAVTVSILSVFQETVTHIPAFNSAVINHKLNE